MVRSLEAELVDALPPEHPEAIRGRRDLRRINSLMGHVSILARQLRAISMSLEKRGAFFPLTPTHSLGERERTLGAPVESTQALSQSSASGKAVSSCGSTLRAEGPGGRSLRLVEIGAGDGEMLLSVAKRLGREWKDVEVTIVDLQDLLREETQAAFSRLGWRVRAVKGDALQWMSDTHGEKSDVILANLFLHHFSDAQLSNLFSMAAQKADGFIALEPRRASWPLFCARSLSLIGFNPVTCHDAPISVRAGFTASELSALWPQDGNWELTERRAGLFSHLFNARRTG